MEPLSSLGFIPLFLLSLLLLNLLRIGYLFGGFMFLRHPITPGLILWLVSGDSNVLLAAVFFELFWLDLFHVGTFVPPNTAFAYLVFAPLALGFGLSSPSSVAVLLLACLPLGPMGAKLEQTWRRMQSKEYHALNGAIDAGKNIMPVADAIFRQGFMYSLLLVNAIYTGVFVVYGAVFWLWVAEFGTFPAISWAGWNFLLPIAAVGGLLSLRIMPALVCFTACAVVLGGIFIFGF